MGLFGSTYLVPVFMQLGLHLPPSQAGAVLLPAGIVLALTIPIAGRLSDRIARHLLIVVGLGLLAGSFALMMGVGAGTALWLIALWTAIGRLGLGFVLPSLNLAAMQSIGPTLVSQGASAVSFMRQLGDWAEPISARLLAYAVFIGGLLMLVVAGWTAMVRTPRPDVTDER